MSNDYLLTTVKLAQTFLARWDAAQVLVRRLQVSPRSLEVVLFRSVTEMHENNLCLYFEPIWMEGYLDWPNASLDVRIVDAASSPATGRTKYECILELRDVAS